MGPGSAEVKSNQVFPMVPHVLDGVIELISIPFSCAGRKAAGDGVIQRVGGPGAYTWPHHSRSVLCS